MLLCLPVVGWSAQSLSNNSADMIVAMDYEEEALDEEEPPAEEEESDADDADTDDVEPETDDVELEDVE